MTRKLIDSIHEAERLILINIKCVITDLNYIERSFLTENIRNENHALLNDMIDSSAELYFKPGTLQYANSSCLAERYEADPAISLDMLFTHKLVAVSFQLHLESDFAGVALGPTSAGKVNYTASLSELSDAFFDARIYGNGLGSGLGNSHGIGIYSTFPAKTSCTTNFPRRQVQTRLTP